MSGAPEAKPAAPEAVVVETTGTGRYQVRARTAAAEFLIDEPASVGGLGAGPNPYDLLAAALGACTAMTVRLYAERKGWPLANARVSVVHSRPALQARDLFHLDITLEGDLTGEQRARLMAIAERCPVHLTLARGSDVEAALASQEPVPVPCASGQHQAGMEEACAD